MPEREYTLTVNAKQASVMREALEMHSRLISGQIGIVVEDLFVGRMISHSVDRKVVNELCDNLKLTLFPELHLNAYHGAGGSTSPSKDISWDIMQVLRHRLAWDRVADEGRDKPEYTMQVQYDPPMQFGSEPLPEIWEESDADHPADDPLTVPREKGDAE